jgi:hypothetical protein
MTRDEITAILNKLHAVEIDLMDIRHRLMRMAIGLPEARTGEPAPRFTGAADRLRTRHSADYLPSDVALPDDGCPLCGLPKDGSLLR